MRSLFLAANLFLVLLFSVESALSSPVEREEGPSLIVSAEPKRLKILLVMASIEACQSHVSFALMLSKVLKRRHSVHLLLLKLTDQEAKFDFSGEDDNFTIEHYVPKSEELVELLKRRKVPDRHWNFARMYNLMANDEELTRRLGEGRFDAGLTEFIFFGRTAPFLFHKLGIPDDRVMFYNHIVGPKQLQELSPETWSKVLAFPMQGQTQLAEFSATYREAHRQEMADFYRAIADDYQQSLAEIDIWLQGQLPSYPGTVEVFRRAPFYFVNTVPEIEMDGGDALSTALVGEDLHRKVVMIGGVHIKKGHLGGRSEELESEIEAKARSMGPVEGIVLMTTGTVIKTWEKIGDSQFDALLDAVDAFPRLLFVVQLHANDAKRVEVLNQKPNVYASHWLKQQQILADPRTKAFIFQCGRHGQLEALFFQKPMICFPFQEDQPYNAVMNMQNGLGTALDITSDRETKLPLFSQTPEDAGEAQPKFGDSQRDFRFTTENSDGHQRRSGGKDSSH